MLDVASFAFDTSPRARLERPLVTNLMVAQRNRQIVKERDRSFKACTGAPFNVLSVVKCKHLRTEQNSDAPGCLEM